MARWLVTQGDRQFSAADLAELKELARSGKVGPGDMVQPPGASDWLYASELPELKGLLADAGGPSSMDDDFDMPKSGINTGVVIAILAVLVIAAGVFMYQQGSSIPDHEELKLLGGEGGLELTEMLVTANPAQLRSEPNEGAAASNTAAKDSKVQLLAKRGEWYHIKTEAGNEGWVSVDAVVPAYFFADAETRENYDPIYNPDNYVFVKNSSWMQLPDQRRNNITVFSFLLQNKSKFDMTDIKLLATIKDKNDKVLEEKEITIEGTIPAYDGVMVGTLKPERRDRDGESRMLTFSKFSEMAEEDESLNLRWVEGVEVSMESEGFVEANIDLLEVRAIPKKLDE